MKHLILAASLIFVLTTAFSADDHGHEKEEGHKESEHQAEEKHDSEGHEDHKDHEKISVLYSAGDIAYLGNHQRSRSIGL